MVDSKKIQKAQGACGCSAQSAHSPPKNLIL